MCVCLGGVDGHIFIIPLVFTVLEFSIKHLSTGFLSNLISLYMYIRDVRYERIPVSVYWKKYTGNTGIPVFWPCKKLSFIGSSES